MYEPRKFAILDKTGTVVTAVQTYHNHPADHIPVYAEHVALAPGETVKIGQRYDPVKKTFHKRGWRKFFGRAN